MGTITNQINRLYDVLKENEKETVKEIVDSWIKSILDEYGFEVLEELPRGTIEREILHAKIDIENHQIWDDDDLIIECNKYYIKLLEEVII